MSKQSDAKRLQGYEPKPALRTCGGCKSLVIEMGLPTWMEKDNVRCDGMGVAHCWGEGSKVIKALTCSIGNFAVKKTAVCNQFTPKEEA